MNRNKKIVYLDYNATTPLAREVYESVNNALLSNWSNPSGNYERGVIAKLLINEARKNVSKIINASETSEIIFTSGGTEANNLVFYSVLNHYHSLEKSGKTSYENKPHFIISSIEHDSVRMIAEHFKCQNIAEFTEINPNFNGLVNVSKIIDSIQKNTILISLMFANNETGVIQPIKELTAKLLELGYNNLKMKNVKRIFVHSDAAQAIGKISIDALELDVDYLTIVGHKFYGPKGIGALYAKKCFDRHTGVPVYPVFFGGGQENNLRPGTENTPMIIGIGRAAELVSKNLSVYAKHMKEIRDYLEFRLESEFGTENLKFNGRSTQSTRLPNTCNVSIIGDRRITGQQILSLAKNIEASTGSCCHSNSTQPSRVLISMGIPIDIAFCAIRFSVGRETSKEEIDVAVSEIKHAFNCLNKVQENC